MIAMLGGLEPLPLLLAAIGLAQLVIALAAVFIAVYLRRLHAAVADQMNHPFYNSPGVLSHEEALALSAEDRNRMMIQAMAEYGDGEHGIS